MDHDPYFAGRPPDKKQPTSRGKRLAFWVIVYLSNQIVPLFLASLFTEKAGKQGTTFAIFLMLGLGCWAVAQLPGVGKAVLIGGTLVGACQVFPLLQIYVGSLGIAMAREMGQTIGRDQLASESGGFTATMVTGGILIAVALLIGSVVQGVSAWFAGPRREATPAKKTGGLEVL